jgi:CRP/FNR family transcriptional regulator
MLSDRMVSRVEILRAMKSSPLFSSLRPAALDLVMHRGLPRIFAAGESVFQAGEPADRFFLVVSGRVKIFKISAGGGEQILHSFGPGETFGEAAMWAGGRFPAYCEALEDTALFSLSRQALHDIFAANPNVAIGMLAGLSRKLQDFVRLIEAISLKEVPARLAGALLAEAGSAGGQRFRLRQTKRELAMRIGTVPETLSRALRKLVAEGLIAVRGAEVTVLKIDALRRRAGEE